MAFLNAVPKSSPSVNSTSTKNAYQQFLSQPVAKEWTLGDDPTNYGQALATINQMYKTDPVKAQEKLTLLNQYRTQPGNKWYDAYAAPTNNAIATLEGYGIDPAELTSDWFKQNTGWQAYLRYNGNTTTPSTPTKKSTDQEKLAYSLYQFQKSMGDTDSAEQQWMAAQDELAYWATRKDLNLSDDDIINKVFGSNKYSTLKTMDNKRTSGSPLELNKAIDYNPDSVRGVIWAARNGGGTGNSRQDIANYYSKVGNVWTPNEEISAKLNKADLSTYSPHEIGMTGKDMDDVGAYFGKSSFAPGEIEDLRKDVDWNDATAVKIFQKGYDAEQTTLAAEAELEEFNRQFEQRLNGRGFSDQNAADKWIEDQLSSGDFKTLAKMDAGIVKGEPINMTRAVPYRKQMYQQMAYDAIANPQKSGAEVLDAYGISVPEAETANTKVENDNFSSALDSIAKYLTKDESDYMNTVPGVEYKTLSFAMNGVKDSIDIEEVGKQYGKVNGEYTKTVLGAIPTVTQYKKYKGVAENLSNSILAYEQNHKDDALAAANVEPEVNIKLSDGSTALLVYNKDTNEYEWGGLSSEDWRTNPSYEQIESVHGEVQQILDKANERLRIRAGMEEATPESKAELEQYIKGKNQLKVVEEWLANNEESYNTAIKSVEDMKAKRDAVGEIAAKSAGYEYDPFLADSIINFAGQMWQYESPPADGYTLIDESVGKSAEQIGKEIAENEAGIKDLKFIIASLGDNIPEELERKFDIAIADAERQNQVYNDSLITNDPNFAKYIADGQDYILRNSESMLDRLPGESKNWFALMTKAEHDIYYALVGRDGDTKAADEFYKNIRDDLQYRMQYAIDSTTEKIAESGWLGRLVSEAGVIVADPINTILGTVYSGAVALGMDPEEASSVKVLSHVSQSVHNANVNAIKETYKDNPALSEVLSGVYEIMYNRGKSFMNAITLGKLMPDLAGGGKVAEFFNNVISATPIALSAASDALENALERGANPTQAALIFGATLMAESWTEGIEFGHIEKAGKMLLTKEGISTFLKSYIPNSVSEVVGESLNDLVENAADNWVKYIDNPDYQNQHDLAVKNAMAEDQNLTPEQAEALVHQAEVNGVLHTAIISFFSPGADVISMAGNTLITNYQYAKEAHDYNKNATGKHAKQKSIRGIRLEHEAAEAEAKAKAEEAKKAQEEEKLAQQNPVVEEQTEAPAQQEAEPEQYPVNGPDESQRRSYAQAMDAYDSNIILLEEAIDANATTQAAAIASALDTGNMYMAQAAGAKLNLGMVQAMLIAGKQANVNLNTIQMGLQLAALGNGECTNIITNGIKNGMNAIQIAQQIAAAVPVDLQNDSVLKGVQAGVHNARVNEEFKRLMATGMAEDAVKAQEKIDAAREATRVAEEEFEQKNNELDAARNGVSEAAAAIAEDPINDGNMLTGALAKMTAAAAVVDEYSQKLDRVRKDQQKTEEDNKKVIETTTAYMRQQAEKAVAEQEAVEAQEKAQAEEQARVAAEEQAKAEAEKMEADNATRLDADAFIEEKFPNISEEEKERLRQQFNDVKQKMGLNSDAILARGKFEKQFAKKFGLNVRHVDSVEENGEKFSLFNARIDQRTGELLVNNKATQNDIFYAVLIHEITHLAEQNEGAYAELADAVLQMQYGDGVTFQGILDQMEKGDISSRLAQDILGKKGLYDERLGRNHTNKEMLQEIVADEVGKIISGDEKALNNLVAEKPSLARRLLDGIINFLNKMRGMQGEVVTQAQKIADMLSAALGDTQTNTEGQVKHSIVEDTDYMSAVESGDMEKAQEIDMDEVEKAVADHIASMSNDELLDYLGLSLPKSWRSEEQVQEFKQEVKSRKQLNAEYDTAIMNGDTAKAGELADEAAKKAGYTLKGIHRTNGEFTVFDKSMQTGERGKTLGNAFYISSPAGSEYDSDSYGKNRMEVYAKTGKMFNLHDGLSRQKAEKVYDKYFAPFVQQDYDDIHKKHVIGQLQKGYKVMDYIGEAAEKNGTTTDEIFKWLGYNSIKDGPQYAIFDPSQIKSADPVTYDDEGNVIPLGKRFKKANDDIRWSLASPKTTEQMIQSWLTRNGLEGADLSEAEARDLYKTLPRDGKRGDGVRQWAVKGAQNSDELSESAKKYVLANRYYKRQTNAEQLDRALAWIRSNATPEDPNGYHASMQEVMSDNFDYRSADGTAKVIAMIGMAAAANDTYGQVALADAYNRQGTELGRALQARNIWRLMTPEGRKNSLYRMLKNLDAELKAKGKTVDLKFSDWIYEAAGLATEEGDYEKVRLAAAKELAEQLPPNWKDRVRSLRMLSMLANPRTHVRNYLGNLLFVPAVGIKNKIGAAVEAVTLDKGERTKSLKILLDSDIRAFAQNDAQKQQDELTGESRWKEGDIVRQQQKPFKGPLQWLIDFNSKMLEKEDWKFLRGHYIRSLGGWMQANGYTVADMENHPEWLEKGRAYAKQEAQKATYRDFNALANKLNQLSREGGPVGFIVDAVLPFKKTPANILKRGVEYSAIGLAKSLSTDLYHLHQYNEAKKNGSSIMPEKAISPNQFIDHMCSGLTGTAIMVLGFVLANAGIVSVGFDDEEDEFDKAKGGQKYALKIRIGGDDVTYTMDWAAPMCMPFFVGAAVQEQIAEEKGQFDVKEFINDLGAIAEPVFNLSMLDGVNTLFETSQYDDTNTITQIGAKVLSNYATSFVPSFIGGVARTIDPNRRKAFVKSGEGSGMLGTFRYAIEQTENKIPGLSQTNIPTRDIWGEAEGDSIVERLIENFASPGYKATMRNDPLIDEMERLYKSADVSDKNKKALVPALPNKKINGVALDAEQYDKLTVQRGQMAKSLLTELMNSDYYKTAADNEKATMVNEVWDYANQTANHDIAGAKLESWVLNSQANPAQGIINRSKTKVANENKNEWKAEAVKAVNAEDYEALDVCIEALSEMGVKDAKSSVKSAIASEYKTQYILAYQRGDYEKMLDIEDTLEGTGLFKQSDFNKWLDDMNKQITDEEEI